MTTVEKVYTAIVIICIGFLFAALGILSFFVLPSAEDEVLIQVVMSIMGFYLAVFTITVALNIAKRELLLIPTVVQSVFLLITLYGTPIAIMGFYLLFKKHKAKADFQKVCGEERAFHNMASEDSVSSGSPTTLVSPSLNKVSEDSVWSGSPSQIINLGTYILCGLLSLTGIGAIFAIPYATWKYLVVKCQQYELTSQRLKVHSGVLNKKTDELELYRVKDTKFDQPLFLRIFDLGNVIIVSSDSTTPISSIYGIKDAQQLREQMRNLIENRRDQKRVRVAEFE